MYWVREEEAVAYHGAVFRGAQADVQVVFGAVGRAADFGCAEVSTMWIRIGCR